MLHDHRCHHTQLLASFEEQRQAAADALDSSIGIRTLFPAASPSANRGFWPLQASASGRLPAGPAVLL